MGNNKQRPNETLAATQRRIEGALLFDECLARVVDTGEAEVITRNNKPLAVLMAIPEYQNLKAMFEQLNAAAERAREAAEAQAAAAPPKKRTRPPVKKAPAKKPAPRKRAS